jgi:ketol-acid reductoisomerase
MNIMATIPARSDSSTWSPATVVSFHQSFWWATNTHTSDLVLNLLPDYSGYDTAEYAMQFTIPAGETVPIAHGMRWAATIATNIYVWTSVADVITIRGHTTRNVTSVQ